MPFKTSIQINQFMLEEFYTNNKLIKFKRENYKSEIKFLNDKYKYK